MDVERQSHGFTLIEAAIAITIIVILAVMIAPLVGGLTDVDRSTRQIDELARVYRAIVGTPETRNFGYLGDVGDYPANLIDLVRNPFPSDPDSGWNGPYLKDVYTEGNVLLDSFGSPLEYFYAYNSGAFSEQLAIISGGPDRGASSQSSTPNDWMSNMGMPLPSSESYPTDPSNIDNIVYPRFTDQLGLLGYNSVGRLNLNVFSYDYAANVSAYVPACPNMFEIKLTSVTRPNDTWGTSSDDTTPTYSPGGASFDLLQGAYRVQLRSRASPHGIYWEDIVDIVPGGSQSRTIYVSGPDSSVTPLVTLNVTNDLSVDVSVRDASGAELGGGPVAAMTTASRSVRGCSRVTILNDSTNSLVDAFAMPTGLGSYDRKFGTGPFTYTITNSNLQYPYLFVYLNGVLAGEVSKWGKTKVKAFTGLNLHDILSVFDHTLSPVGSIDVDSNSGQSF